MVRFYAVQWEIGACLSSYILAMKIQVFIAYSYSIILCLLSLGSYSKVWATENSIKLTPGLFLFLVRLLNGASLGANFTLRQYVLYMYCTSLYSTVRYMASSQRFSIARIAVLYFFV